MPFILIMQSSTIPLRGLYLRSRKSLDYLQPRYKNNTTDHTDIASVTNVLPTVVNKEKKT